MAQDAILGPEELTAQQAADLVARFDGLLLLGGGDIGPSWYGQERHERTYGVIPVRDSFEHPLCAAAIDAGLPILAICRGTQVLNVVRGGTLHQHMTDDFPGHGKPGVEGGQNVHDVNIDPDSRLGAAMGVRVAACSCHHHQAVDAVGRGLRVIARSPDGVIEGLELDGDAWVVAAQWHPEDTAGTDPVQQRVFDAFVRAAG